ncbi:hypothetical protein JM18_004513 [Phytophthora kernoviae]|uniref:ABC transporter domain-containing protein n=2 Tax=Phytophthora kernoviae TaxID=325452 RepID=A0A8T0M1H3_9STRA|nr:hypothetical protein G195_005769 [Phytophthora kernoviae 00238/432]KAG2526195.1 hypothetical protein JM18_004513 [Phytophthora kernoviae]KAG2526867.1 hypothetical protein JM16_003644 [Phytophthora kernoviae]
MARYGTFDSGGGGNGGGSSSSFRARSRIRRRSCSSPPSSDTSSTSSSSSSSTPERPHQCLVDETSASLLSRLAFLFVEPLVVLGGTQRLLLEDLWTLEPENTSERAAERFREVYSESNHLLTAIWRTEWRTIICSGGLGLCSVLITSCIPLLLFKLLTAVMDPDHGGKSVLELLLLLVGIQVAMVLGVLFDRHARFRMFKAQLRVVASTRLLVFAKSVERPVKGKHGTSTSIATIATLYSSNLVQTLHTSAKVILTSLAIIIGALSALTSFSARILQWYTKKRAKTLAAVNECFKGIQSIKLYAWEDKILSKIMSARRKEERRQCENGRLDVNTYPENVVAVIDHASLVVGEHFQTTVLTNVNLQVNTGELVVIHGKAGAGKTTLLTSLLGEVTCVSGSVFLSPKYKVAYCSEQPWLQTLSIKDNVIFGSTYDESKYYRVLDACCLLEDLESLPDGDDTMIGPKGINLSGGQKSRIALARTLYSDADLYLLDRPLASADAIVQSDVFRKCFLELLRYKTVIVATHNPEVVESGFVDRVFSEVTKSLLRAPMAVLYQTPIGEILARSTVSIAAALGTMGYLLGMMGVVIAVLTVYMCRGIVDKRLFAQVYTLRATLDAADLNFVSEALDGAAVIRSFGAEQIKRAYLHHGNMVDDRSRIATVVEVFTHWLYIRCSLVVGIFMFCLAVLLAHGGLQASTLGLVLHCIYGIQRDFVSFSVGILNTSVNMFSIANLKKFQEIPPEEGIDRKNGQQRVSAPRQWPSTGSVVFDHVFFQYDTVQQDPSTPTFALKDVSFSVSGGEKIGIVGRTGSGKSSLAMAMLQMHSLPRGRIIIDGADLSRLCLRDIRSRICIIPQTPLFYRCSIRRYLDPFKEFDDDELWEVLMKVGLCDVPGDGIDGDEADEQEAFAEASPNRVVVTTLDKRMEENGENWSMGERQMLVLARSLLKPARVLILDEAFSSVDQECDKQLLKIVEKEFANSTIFLITHRLDQVLGFDRIIVMKDGAVAECGAAEDLVTDPDSVFFDFLETTLLTY